MKRLQNLILIMLFLPLMSMAQLEGGVFLGGVGFDGDTVVPDFFDISETNFGYGLMVRNSFTPKIALRGNLLFGKVTGDDANYTDPSWRQTRAMNFSSPITEISLQLEWSPLSKEYNKDAFEKSWSPYLFAGIGGVFINLSLIHI